MTAAAKPASHDLSGDGLMPGGPAIRGSGDQDDPTEGLPALDVGVRRGRVGERVRAIDDHGQLAGGDRGEVRGDQVVDPGTAEDQLGAEEDAREALVVPRIVEMSSGWPASRPASPTVFTRPRWARQWRLFCRVSGRPPRDDDSRQRYRREPSSQPGSNDSRR